MYSGLHDYKAAVLAFQKDLGEKPTGVLTVWQISQLTKRTKAQKFVRIYFPDDYFSIKNDGYAYVEGTVKILDENIYWPVNYHKIECYKDDNYCEVRQIMLGLPKAKSNSSTIYQVLVDKPIKYKVTRWNDNVIEAQYVKSPIDTTNCRTTNLSLNFKTKEFYFITKNEGGKCEYLCAKRDELPKPHISQVVNGQKIISEEFRKIAKLAYDFLSSDFRNKSDEIIKKYKDKAAEEQKKKINK